MYSGRLNYVVVGVFVVAMLAALIVSLAVLMGRTGATDDYYVIYRNVIGVKFGTQVLYEGYAVGQVTKVAPETAEDSTRFRVDISVEKGWKIPVDSIAAIIQPRMLSAEIINIRGGESPVALKPGGRLEGLERADVFSAMSSLAARVSQLTEGGLEPLLASINETVDSARTILSRDIEPLAHEFRSLVEVTNTRLPSIIENLEQFTGTLNDGANDFRALVGPENRAQVAAMIGSLNSAAANLSSLSAKLDRVVQTNSGNIDKSVADMRYIMGSIARDIDSINQNLEGTARNMYEFSRHIRQNPGLLLGGTPPKDAARGR
jgi:phospholipid/cholesterol/gamma-HCH transport system substrate-binding protein